MQHCAGINCLAVCKTASSENCDNLFTGSRDGTVKRWAFSDDTATCSATFESHVDWVCIPHLSILIMNHFTEHFYHPENFS